MDSDLRQLISESLYFINGGDNIIYSCPYIFNATVKVADFCTHQVVVGETSDTLLDAAKRMSLHNSDYLVVIERNGDYLTAKGVLTDRDIIKQTILEDIEPGGMTLADIIIRDPVIAREDDEIENVIGRMTEIGLRYVPVVNNKGMLTGIITIDVLFNMLYEEVNKLRLLMPGANTSGRIRKSI